MPQHETLVLDSSVGVKWFTRESGRAAALALVTRAAHGEITLMAPAHFAHEVLAVIGRHYTPADIPPAWDALSTVGITLLPLTDEVVAEAAHQCQSLRCTFYDALAPACAVLLDAGLATADRRAHGAFPGAIFID